MVVACSESGGENLALVTPTAVTVQTTLPPAATAETVAPSPSTTAPPAYETPVAHALSEVTIYVAPTVEIETRTVPAKTILGTPTVMPVLEGPNNGWVKLSLPGRPNEASGWARADQLTFAKVDQRIEIDLATAILTFFDKGQPVLTTAVSVGSPSNPTPAGEFFVTDIVSLTDPSGPWGPYALGLSARSDTITEFNGGDGIIGIHGTNRPDRIGQPVSLGCVRVPNEVIAEIARMVQLGIPVSIG